ncbi:MAG TPA: thioredoxin domain-containing protein [Acidimicrobiales bacterium]|nr:thioredoxin domain-containing protein [Acidimicrobiales bacterium]
MPAGNPGAKRLAGESSPYLRQHADNPVDWYPWGPDMFEAARSRDVPILLSVGYSACHWCHVMAHESFEDDAAASVMNEGFVCVKVDREERPDVDAVYMEAVQALTGSGGWPMTVFLLPDGRPFHGGTYFPRPVFVDLLDQITHLWRTKRPEVESAAQQLSEAVRSGTGVPSEGWAPSGDAQLATSPELLDRTVSALLGKFDQEWGGLGRAPKFPQPTTLETVMQAAACNGRIDAAKALATTLDAMAAGGIYDHLGGGFARYSTDREWLVPHFEKMLYDNALLARLYLHAWQMTGRPDYSQVVSETLGYLLRAPMRIAGAGFASAEDADSEGEEGRFYVWDHSEVEQVGGRVACEWYGVTPSGNWEGRNILRRPVGSGLARPAEVEEARAALFERREGRVRPGLDDKMLTEWNAMAVAALAEAGAALGRQDWVESASDVARFLLGSLRRDDGRWMRSWQAEGGARHLAYASDHAWLVEAFTRVYEATGDSSWLAEARDAAGALIDLFWDPEAAAFATTGRDAEELIARPVDTQDGALPSANSVAAGALLRLGALTGEAPLAERARSVVESMAPALGAAPAAFSGMVAVAEALRKGLTEVVVTGDRPDLLGAYRSLYLPRSVLAWGRPFDSPIWEGRTGPETAGLAFVCEGYSCKAPASDPSQLVSQLAG